ncbi:hypothetical protein [Pseudocolwellia sp. HL-MZ7]|uniref:hypothetical protein n=1 Tax=Pseudocolwellia sp. HL-MZ7 TaxID=3400627 RepID=UPI003CE7CC64
MEIYQRVKSIPVILRTVFLASFFIGVFQIVALIFPELSPKMEGEKISSSVLMVFMGAIHLALGLGLFYRKKWSIILLIIFPIMQYSIYYLDTSLPAADKLQIDLIFSFIWAFFFVVYIYGFKYKSYFYEVPDA